MSAAAVITRGYGTGSAGLVISRGYVAAEPAAGKLCGAISIYAALDGEVAVNVTLNGTLAIEPTLNGDISLRRCT